MEITDYQFGRVDVDGVSYQTDVIIQPEKVIDSWWRTHGHRLTVEDLRAIETAQPDILVIGTGYYGKMSVPEQTQSYLKSKGIEVAIAPTGEAVKRFNELQKNNARVVAALHLSC